MASRFVFLFVAALAGNGLAANTNLPEPRSSMESLETFDGLVKVLRDYYPMLELAGFPEGDELHGYREQVSSAATTGTAFEVMDALVCRLNDYHTRFFWPGKPEVASPAFRVEPVATETFAGIGWGIWSALRPPREMPALPSVAFAVTQAGSGLQLGDELLEVNGEPIEKALARAWPHAVGCSVAGKLRSACWQMLLGPADVALELRLRRTMAGTNTATVEMKIPRGGGPLEDVVSTGEMAGLPYIRITRFGDWKEGSLVREFDAFLEKNRDQPALIIDVRGNGGGQDGLADELTGRFITNPVIASISFHREVPILKFRRTVEWTQPRGPWRYPGRVAVLADEGSMSACEHFVSGMVEAGALLCGTPTSGACGWIRPMSLPHGARVNVSRTFPLHTGGIPSPLLGIAPHIWAPRDLVGLQQGADAAGVAAARWLKSSYPRPPRFQPH
jgi:carboxyl-terminal processing protease